MVKYKKYGAISMLLTCVVQIVAMERALEDSQMTTALYTDESSFFVQPLAYYRNHASYATDLGYAELEFSKNKLMFSDFAQQKKEFWKEKKTFLDMYKNKDFGGFLSGIFLYNPGADVENIPKIRKMIAYVHSDCLLTEEEKWLYLDLLYAQHQSIQAIFAILKRENDLLVESKWFVETILDDQPPLKKRRTKGCYIKTSSK
jgi:hypothetical protein